MLAPHGQRISDQTEAGRASNHWREDVHFYEDDNQVDLDHTISSKEDVKKSYLTGELKKLSQSLARALERQIFVKKLENALRAPAKTTLWYVFDEAVLGINVLPLSNSSSNLFDSGTLL